MLTQFRDPRLSVWQSSIDQALHQSLTAQSPGQSAARPGLADATREGDILREASRYCSALFNNTPIGHLLRGTPGLATALPMKVPVALGDQLSYCSSAYLKLADAQLHGDDAGARQCASDIKFGNCDPRYQEALTNYLHYFKLRRQPIPYRPAATSTDFIDEIGDQCTIALVGDWGTGQDPAIRVLKSIAAKNPDVIVHLGDIYYSGTQYEADNYFLKLFQTVFGRQDFAANTRPRIFTMAGNHDMYSGGQGYYWLLDQIHQSASFFG